MSSAFAVDLGAWSVKVAVASPGLRGATLMTVVERLVPQGEEPHEVRAKAVLASIVEELKLRDSTGYIGVYGDQVFTQVLEFAFKSLRRAELDKAVGGELEGVVPVDLEDMVYTFEQLPMSPAITPEAQAALRGRLAPPPMGMRVLTYAMRRDRAEELIDLGKACGFEPRGVLAAGGAAVRLVERTPSLATLRSQGAPIAVIDIGHERTDVVVVAQGKAVFSRGVGRAGKQVTDAIARNWKLPWPDAERAKHSDGFVASQAEPASSQQWLKIHEVTVSELAPLARDLRQTLAACRAKTGFQPAAVLLVGGGSRLRGLASYMAEQLGVQAWRPTKDDLTALAGPRIPATVSAGLPLDSAALTVGMVYDAAGGRPMFDLRSGALAHRMDLSFLRSKAVPLGAAVLAVAAFAAGSAFADLYRLKKAEKVLNERLATESKEVYGESKTVEQIFATNKGGGAGGASPLPKASAFDVLLEISSKIPPKDKIQIDVDTLDIADKKVEISGFVKTPEQIDLLIHELGTVKCFKDITRGNTEVEGELQKFKLTINAPCM